jgi:hypothetical protein
MLVLGGVVAVRGGLSDSAEQPWMLADEGITIDGHDGDAWIIWMSDIPWSLPPDEAPSVVYGPAVLWQLRKYICVLQFTGDGTAFVRTGNVLELLHLPCGISWQNGTQVIDRNGNPAPGGGGGGG